MKNLFLSLFCFATLLFACGEAPAPAPSAEVKNENYYTEAHRLQYHFSPEKMWMNDPNGLVFYEGEYHLFYQHYPDSNVWGPMHWGHAVSTDLLHWEHLPIALYPDSLGYIFSGSAVVDWNNTSGFGNPDSYREVPPLVAIFTHHEPNGAAAKRIDYQYQSLAYSNDKGRTWTKYEGNPVLPNPGIENFRDPKVSWHEDSKQWIMALAVNDHVKFYSSPDLKKWTYLSDFGKEWGSHGGVWECPDLFPILANGKDKKWVLLLSINPGGPNEGSATQYFVGNFDGKTFTLDPEFAKDVKDENAVWLDWGPDNYAGVTWSDVPKEDGRRLFLGWMSNWNYGQVVPTEIWRSAMTVPRSLTLNATAQGLRIASQPVQELTNLRRLTYTIDEQPLTNEIDLAGKLEFSPSAMEVLMEVEIPEGSTADFGVALSNSKGEEFLVGYDAGKGEFYTDRTKSGPLAFSAAFAPYRHVAKRTNPTNVMRFQVFFDVSSCELFADWGTTVMTSIFFPSENYDRVKIYSKGGEVKIKSGNLYQLKPIWR